MAVPDAVDSQHRTEFHNEAPSDLELLRQHLAGDAQAFNELVRRHRRSLWAIALRIVSDPHQAEDAVQTALLQAFRNARSYRGEADVVVWLRVIVENVAKTSWRDRQRAGRQVVDPTSGENERRLVTGPADEGVETMTTLRAAIAELPDEQRRALFLVRVQGYTLLEAAHFEDVALGTIKSRVSRARATLAALMDAND